MALEVLRIRRQPLAKVTVSLSLRARASFVHRLHTDYASQTTHITGPPRVAVPRGLAWRTSTSRPRVARAPPCSDPRASGPEARRKSCARRRTPRTLAPPSSPIRVLEALPASTCVPPRTSRSVSCILPTRTRSSVLARRAPGRRATPRLTKSRSQRSSARPKARTRARDRARHRVRSFSLVLSRAAAGAAVAAARPLMLPYSRRSHSLKSRRCPMGAHTRSAAAAAAAAATHAAALAALTHAAAAPAFTACRRPSP